MTRLDAEFNRLFTACPGAQDDVRALVLEVAGPADWTALGGVWRGVQVDLALPAPAIAVNGRDALQLWFSAAEPVTAAEGHAWLDALRRRYLPGLPARRVRLRTGVAPAAWADLGADPGAAFDGPAARVPAAQAVPDQWSAFVAQDLAPIFEDTPWLDIPPGDDGQAQLLAALKSLTAAQWAQSTAALVPASAADAAPAAGPRPAATPPGLDDKDAQSTVPGLNTASSAPPDRAVDSGPSTQDPRAFLLRVMNDPGQPMALRIEAAKALLG